MFPYRLSQANPDSYSIYYESPDSAGTVCIVIRKYLFYDADLWNGNKQMRPAKNYY